MPPKPKKAAPSHLKKKAVRIGSKPAQKPLAPPPSPPPPQPSRPHSTTHIRPPYITYGNPSIYSLLHDDNAISRYQGFKDRPFVQIHILTRAFLDSLQIAKLHDMLSCQPMTSFLLDNHDHIFPGMVGQFFANLHFDNTNHNIITSRVNRIPIKLDSQLLNAIFGTTLADSNSTSHYWDDSHLWPQTGNKFKISELRTMFNVASREAKDFNPSNLAPVDRVIYHILVNFVNPVAGHFTNPGKVPLVYYYLFTHHTLIDWGFVVFHRLCDTITEHRRNLPHAQFLSSVFKHFQVPFTEVGIAPHSFDISTLHKKGIRLHHGQWITRTEYLSMTQSSAPSHPQSTAPTAPSTESASLLASVQCLQKSITQLLNHVRYLEHGVKMAMSTPALQDEFESDKILFGISSEDSEGNGDHDSAAVDSECADSAESLSESDGTTDSEHASASSTRSATDGDIPLVQRLKKAKTVP